MQKKIFIDVKKCIGCSTCVLACPKKAISLINEKAVINNKICVSCGSCESVCPVSAIKFK
jgi:Fe-S-cluster-containing hydrogenase component 2